MITIDVAGGNEHTTEVAWVISQKLADHGGSLIVAVKDANVGATPDSRCRDDILKGIAIQLRRRQADASTEARIVGVKLAIRRPDADASRSKDTEEDADI